MRRPAIIVSLLLSNFAIGTVLAAPPPWAPAHGVRKKQERMYVGYSQREWPADYGVTSGRCNTDDVLAAVGAVAGGVIGNRVADPGNRTIATIVGIVIGGVVGDRIGDRIDARDRACVGHSLELARTGQTVRWVNPESGLSYAVTPVRDRESGRRTGGAAPCGWWAAPIRPADGPCGRPLRCRRASSRDVISGGAARDERSRVN
jgi:surface antigen